MAEMTWRRVAKLRVVLSVLITLAGSSLAAESQAKESTFQAGAAAVDVSPVRLPVIVNGNFFAINADKVVDPLHARALVLSDGSTTIAICVIDSCVIPREVADQIKALVHTRTGIPVNRILISATHTHSAPSLMKAHASEIDPYYPQFLVVQAATAIERAKQHLAAAEVGWTVVDDRAHTYCRQWIYRPDKIGLDPFGLKTVRANMHPPHESPDHVGPEGPVDPGLSLLSVRTLQGVPIAVLANYSMHYFGAQAVSADYYGHFAARLAALASQKDQNPPLVAIMSQGTSGDLMWPDYGKPRVDPGLAGYANAVAELAFKAYQTIEYRTTATLTMAQRDLPLTMRVPDAERLAWARKVVAELKDQPPKDLGQIYAREQIFLHDNPQRDVLLQAIRVGDLGITAIPCEVFGITGLKIKAQSPLQPTFNIELANGEDGYIPPPELHPLGGYTTWACRTAGLEVNAEPKIVEAVLSLLEEVAGRKRRPVVETHGAHANAVLASKPLAYYRLNDWAGTHAQDASPNKRPAKLETGFAFYLDGPQNHKVPNEFSGEQINRAMHFAGGRIVAPATGLKNDYTTELWFWNGLPNDARAVTGDLISREAAGAAEVTGDRLAISGTQAGQPGRLIFSSSKDSSRNLVGKQVIAPKSWNHVALVRRGNKVEVFLNGQTEPEIAGQVEPGFDVASSELSLAGRGANASNLEGKLDEVAIYNRALTPAEIAAHFQAAGTLAP